MKTKSRWLSLFLCLLLALNFIKIDCIAAEEVHLGEIIDGSQLTEDNESVGTVQDVLRGTYLANGSCGISDNGNGTVYVSGETYCYRTSDTVKVIVYLQQLKNGSWCTVSQYSNTAYDTYSVSVGYNVAVSKGYYYRIVGAHSATKGNVVETQGSQTNGIWID